MVLALSEELNMFTSKPNLRRRNRAVTLIEAVLYISIALALIVGGLVFFQQASTAAKTSTMVRQLSAVLAETRVLMNAESRSTSEFNQVEDLTPTLIAAGAAPPDMVQDAVTLSNPFGGTTRVVVQLQRANAVQLTLTNVPQGVCARLLTSTSASQSDNSGWDTPIGSTTVVSSGFISGSAIDPTVSSSGNTAQFFVMNVTQAGWMCKYGRPNYTDKNREPNSAPISGNVTVSMWFRI
jgi:cytoskeletal protein RodZ